MKNLAITVLAGGLLAGIASAQSADEAKYAKKLAQTFAKHIKWENSLADAQAKAKKESKLIFGYFSRSYAP